MNPRRPLRLLRGPTGAIDDKASSQWFADQFQIATAEAWLAADEVEQAIAILAQSPSWPLPKPDCYWPRHCDVPAASEPVPRSWYAYQPIPSRSRRALSVRLWLLQAEVAVEQGNYDRADVLVDRALRTAVREQLRVIVASAGKWLRSFVAQEPGLSRRYSAFLASLPRGCDIECPAQYQAG